MKHIRRILVSTVVLVQIMLLGALLTPTPAKVSAAEGAFCQRQIGGFFGLPTWYKYLEGVPFGSAPCDIEFNARSAQSYVRIAMALFEILMRVAGMAALAIVMYGAFQFLTSQGEPEKYAAARTTIINALIGLAIALFAVSIVNLVGTNVT